MAVAVHVVGPGIVSNIEVRPAIVVDVSPDHTHSVIMMAVINASLLGNILEGAVAAIVKEEVAFALHAPRSTLHLHPAKLAELFVAAQFWQFAHIHVHVTGDEKIDVTIAVIVSPGRPETETADGHACPV